MAEPNWQYSNALGAKYYRDANGAIHYEDGSSSAGSTTWSDNSGRTVYAQNSAGPASTAGGAYRDTGGAAPAAPSQIYYDGSSTGILAHPTPTTNPKPAPASPATTGLLGSAISSAAGSQLPPGDLGSAASSMPGQGGAVWGGTDVAARGSSLAGAISQASAGVAAGGLGAGARPVGSLSGAAWGGTMPGGAPAGTPAGTPGAANTQPGWRPTVGDEYNSSNGYGMADGKGGWIWPDGTVTPISNQPATGMGGTNLPYEMPAQGGSVSGSGGGAVWGGTGGSASGGGGAANSPVSPPATDGPVNREVVAKDETIEGRIGRLMSQDANGNYTNPVIQQAVDGALSSFAGRGLLNSSMATQAASQAAIAKAIEIAGPDAQTYFSQGRANQDAQNVFKRDDKGYAQENMKLDKTMALDREKMNQQGSQFNKELEFKYEAMRLDKGSQKDATDLAHKYSLEMSNIKAVDSAYDLYIRRVSDIDANKDYDAATKIQMKNSAGKDFDLYAKAKSIVYNQQFGTRYSGPEGDKKPEDKAPSGGGSGGGSSGGSSTNPSNNYDRYA